MKTFQEIWAVIKSKFDSAYCVEIDPEDGNFKLTVEKKGQFYEIVISHLVLNPHIPSLYWNWEGMSALVLRSIATAERILDRKLAERATGE